MDRCLLFYLILCNFDNQYPVSGFGSVLVWIFNAKLVICKLFLAQPPINLIPMMRPGDDP